MKQRISQSARFDLPRPIRRAWTITRDQRGVAGIEFALVAATLCLLLLNVFDIGRYLYIRMQVHQAAQMGAQAAWTVCDESKVPASENCDDWEDYVTAGVRTTSLGAAVELQSDSPSEGYYCFDGSNALQLVESDVADPPSECADYDYPAARPGYYVKVDVTYRYRPLFLDISVAGLFPTPLTKTSYMRLL